MARSIERHSLGTRYIDLLMTKGKMPEKDWSKLHPQEQDQLERLFNIRHLLDEPTVILTPRNQMSQPAPRKPQFAHGVQA